MSRYHGRKGKIYLPNSGTNGAAVPAVSLSMWSLDKTTDKVDVTAFGDANKVYVQGLPDVKGSVSGFFDDTDDSLFDAAESTSPVNMYLYPSTDAPTIYHYGPAWLDASIDTNVSGAITVKGSFVAACAWGRKP